MDELATPPTNADSPHQGGLAHIPPLDGLRGVAILIVMLFHMTVSQGPTWLDRAWYEVLQRGAVGVDLFFVLSGFLITRLLLADRRSPRYLGNFYMRRVLRIFPLYYALLVFALLVLPRVPFPGAERLGSLEGDEVYYWTYLSNVAIARAGTFRHGILDVSWSLAIEEQFYLVWPLLVRAVPPRFFLRGCLLLVGASLATRTLFVTQGASWAWCYVFTPCRLDGLVLGAALAHLEATGGLRALRPHALLVIATAGPASLLLLARQTHYYQDVAFQLLGYTTVAFTLAALLLLVLVSPTAPAARALEHWTLTGLGRYSYALYLVHYPLRGLIRDKLYRPGDWLQLWGSTLPGQLIFYAIGGALSLAVAWTSWHAFEKRFLRLKRYFRGPLTPPAQSGARPLQG